MKKIIKHSLFLAFLATFNILSINNLYSQFSADADGVLNVSNTSGIVNYIYPISNQTVDGHLVNVSLNYNSDMNFMAFDDYDRGFTIYSDGWYQIARNHPGWVIGVNGFTVQLLGHKFNFTTQRQEGRDYDNPDKFIWVADGYDVCNRMRTYNWQKGLSCDDNDEIHILKSDGSVLQLVNPLNRSYIESMVSPVTDNDKKLLYTGIYYEEEANSHGYGKVEFDSTYWTDELKESIPLIQIERNEWIPRVLRYYPGDGLEYVFREYPAPYGKSKFKPNGFSGDFGINGGNALPTIFYLEEINTQMRNIATFKRAYHNRKANESPNYIDSNFTHGRAPLTEFTGHKINYGDGQITIEAYGRTIKLLTKASPYKFENYFWDDGRGTYTQQSRLHTLMTKTTSSATDRNSEHEITMVTDILDPMNRKTSFRYEITKKKFDILGLFGVDCFYNWVFTPRLDTIIEPTKAYTFSYYKASENSPYLPEGSSIFFRKDNKKKDSPQYWLIYPDVSLSGVVNNTDHLLNYNYNFIIKEMKKFNFVNYQIGDLLETYHYTFQDDKAGTYKRISTVEHIDNINNKTDKIETYYKRFDVAPFTYNEHENLRTPYVVYTYPAKSVSTNGDITTIKTITVKPMSDISSINSNKCYYTTEKLSQLIKGSDTITTSKETIEYEFEDLGIYSNDIYLEIKPEYGYEVKKMITKTIRPDNFSDTLYKTEIEYLNLPLKTVSCSRQDTIYDREQSILKTKELRSKGIDTTVILFNIATRSANDSLRIPPQWGLLRNTVTMSGNGTVLFGKINNIDTNFSTTNPLRRRGAIISDTIIGKNNEKVLRANYYYQGGWFRNLLNSQENIFGTRNIMYFDYEKVPWLNNSYLIGKKLFNNNNIGSQKLFHEFKEFDSPLAFENKVRKFNISGGLDTTKFDMTLERSYFGLVSGIIDINGWYSESVFDSNGRNTIIRLPYDFPPNEYRFFNNSTTLECMPIYDFHTEITSHTDTIKYSNERFSYGSSSATHSDYSMMRVGNVVGNSMRFYDTTMTETQSNPVSAQYVTKVNYHPDPNDALHQASGVNQLYLKLFLTGGHPDQCMLLKIRVDRFNFEKKILFGGSEFGLLPNACEQVPVDGKIPELRFDLMPLLDSILNLASNDNLEINISSSSLNGMIDFVRLSDDLGPCITVGAAPNNNHDDFTYASVYNDSARTIKSYGKIDDEHHTAEGLWEQSTSTLDGRYTGIVSFHREGDLSFKINKIIGNPYLISPFRIDSIVKSLSGTGTLLNTKDEDLNLSKVFYDNTGRVDSIAYPDGNGRKYYYNVGRPGDLLDTTGNNNQDFYGFCSEVISVNEIGRRDASYTDAFGRLRRTIVDLDTMKVMTKYEYDTSGNIKYVINPKGDTTFYWYDNFNRLIYKYQKDADFSSFNYDKIGRLRFSQNRIQADSNKLSYFEYDDLGRTTIIGEAKIDTTGLNLHNPQTYEEQSSFKWLTTALNPNVLNYSGYEGVINANSTIYKTPTKYARWIAVSNDTTSILPDSTDFKRDSIPIAPYLKHTIDYYDPLFITAGINNFEDMSLYPEFVRKVICYDTMPSNSGTLWKKYPLKSFWGSLMPNGTLNNQKGRAAVIAYKDNNYSPFHCVVFSYDPRGRVEAILRYTENIGYDAVYYTYNSSDQILTVKTVDALRQHLTWYGYDDNGRVDSVWSKLGNVGSGFNLTNLSYPDDLQKPSDVDVVYYYDKRGAVEKIVYNPVNVTQFNNYSKRGWLDSMIAIDNYNALIFREVLERDQTGNIIKQRSRHINQTDSIVQNYMYDRLQRLTGWNDNGTSTGKFGYDIMGNRLADTANSIITNYSYNAEFSNRLNVVSSNDAAMSSSILNYNNTGATINRTDYKYINGINTDIAKEEFKYNSINGLLEQFTKYEYSEDYSEVPCSPSTLTADKWIWSYRYSAVGGREQKRLLYSPHGDSCNGYSHPWEYYLLGAGGEMLATYHGRQTAETIYTDERSVFMYATAYYSAGGIISSHPDTSKEFRITDHIGSVRVVIKIKGTTVTYQGYDYKPFGDSLNTSTGTEAQFGFSGEERDIENRYTWYGARQYDSRLGRFLSADPLLELFVNHTPYQYAFNSPVVFSDVSGLAPEEEKNKKDKILEGEHLLISSSQVNSYVIVITEASPLNPEVIKRVRNKTGPSLDWDYEEYCSELIYTLNQAYQHRFVMGSGRLGFLNSGFKQYSGAPSGGSDAGGKTSGISLNGIVGNWTTGGYTNSNIASFPYSNNKGINLNVNYKFIPGQSLDRIEGLITSALNYLSGGAMGYSRLFDFTSYNVPINCDFTMSGSEIAAAWNRCGRDYEWVGGNNCSVWNNACKTPFPPPGSSPSEFQIGWTNFASDFLGNGFTSKFDFYYFLSPDGSISSDYPYDFNLTFTHEVGGHKWDAMFGIGLFTPTDKEFSARFFTGFIVNGYKKGYNYSDWFLDSHRK